MGEGFGETLWGLQIQFSLLAPTLVIISDFKEEEQVEKKTTKVEEEVEQLVKVEQLVDFSLAPIEGGFFDVEVDYFDILIVVPTKA